MAFNIMDMITDQITPDNVGMLSKFLGEDSSLITKGISAAAPLLLGSLLGSTSKPEGVSAFNQALDKADPGLLGNLAGALSGSGGSTLASNGTSMLTSLLGGGTLASLVKAISGFGGLSSGSSKSLLGLAAPMLMSMLSKKKQDDGLDNSGMLSMLNGQKNNIGNALTPEMRKSFSGLGLLDGFTGQAGESVKAAAQSVSNTAQHATKESKSLFSRLLPIIIIALIAWFAYQYFMKPGPGEESSIAPVTEQALEAMNVGGTNLGKELLGTFDSAKRALTGITDTDSATAALGSLTEVNQSLASITGLAGQLPPEGKQMLAKIAANLSVGLDGLLATAYKIPGVENILGSSISSLRQSLSALANL